MDGAGELVSTGGKTAIWAAVIGAGGAVVAAVIGLLHDNNGPASSTSPATTPRAVATAQISPTDSRSPGVFVYTTPVSDPTADRKGPASTGTTIHIICSQQGPMGARGTTVWYKIQYNGDYAFISAGEVNMSPNQPDPPSC